jgi:uncharacterized protein YgbK (DUF1537 family)
MHGHDIEAAIVADDLTGALDMAAPFASRGFATRLLLDHRLDATDADTQILTLTSASRELPAAAAAESIRVAMRAALARRPRILISKIDSTLRGNVANAIVAALAVSGLRHALIAPTVPSQGRTMRGGEVFVNGVPLRKNPLRFDPLEVPSMPLPDLLRAAAPEIMVHSWPRGPTSPLSTAAGLHAYVADGESDDDLDALARFAIGHAGELLVVGASGLGTAIAEQLAARSTPKVPPADLAAGKRAAGTLFVIGSRTEVSAEQIGRLLVAGASELATVDQDAGSAGIDVLSDVRSRLWVVRPAASLAFRKEASREIAATLARTAARLIDRLDIDAVVMSGGDTALAMFQALGTAQAVLFRELSPGVAVGTFQVKGMPVTFVTKSGSFGDPDALLEIARSLRAD